MPVFRSFLFAPGDHERRVAKVFEVGADAAILDLEDAVANARKVAARPLVRAAMQRPHTSRGYVRVNGAHTEYCFGDLMEVIRAGLDGIVLPMVESAQQVQTVDWVITQVERENGLPAGGVDLIPLIETAAGLRAIDEIARAVPRVRRLAFGAGDFTLDLNVRWTAEESELYAARTTIVIASRAAGLEPPIDSVWPHLQDPEGFKRSSALAAGLGFQGKLCIHPSQVPVVNELFAPTPAEVAQARRIVEAFDEAEKKGLAAIQVDGQFVDYPVVYRARRVLDFAQSVGITGRS